MRRILRTVPLLALGLLSSASVRGDDDAAALKKGKALYDEAVVLLDAKKYDEACPKLQEATRLVPVAVGARLALGECEEGRGHLATALSSYRKAEALAASAGQPDREKAAKDHAAAIENKVGSIAFTVRAEDAAREGFEIQLDGRRLEPAERAAPVLVDAGKHTVTATAKPSDRFEKTLDTKDGDHAEVAVSFGGAPAVTAAPTATAVPTTAPSSSPLRTVGLVAGIAGIAALGAGAGLGGLAIAKNDESFTKGCQKGGRCPAEGADARRAAYDAATISTALFIGGGVLAAAGVTLFVIAPRPSASKQGAAGVSVAVTPGPAASKQGAGVSVAVAPNGLLLHGSF